MKKNHVGKCIMEIREIMENANLPMKNLDVKLKVDSGYAENWANAH